MATQTTNYGLTKPSYNETADIGVINSNMDIIDAKMKENADNVSTLATEVDELSKNMEVLSVPVAITDNSLQSDYCTIRKNNTYKIGKLVVGFLMLQVTQDIPMETCIIKGLPRPKSDMYVLCYDVYNATKRIQLNRTVGDTDGQLYSFREQFATNNYIQINFAYVCD